MYLNRTDLYECQHIITNCFQCFLQCKFTNFTCTFSPQSPILPVHSNPSIQTAACHFLSFHSPLDFMRVIKVHSTVEWEMPPDMGLIARDISSLYVFPSAPAALHSESDGGRIYYSKMEASLATCSIETLPNCLFSDCFMLNASPSTFKMLPRGSIAVPHAPKWAYMATAWVHIL